MSACKDQDPRIHGIKTKIRVVPNFPKPGFSSFDRPFFFVALFSSRVNAGELKKSKFLSAGFLLFYNPRKQKPTLSSAMTRTTTRIMFQDITTLLLDPKAFKDTIDLFVERYKGKNISVVAGKVWKVGPVEVLVLKLGTITCDMVWRGIEARGFIFGPPIALAIGAKFVPLRKPRKLPGEVISEEYILEYGRDCLEMHVGAVEPGDRALVVDDLIATGGTLCAAMNLLERVGAEVVECACVIELPDLKGRDRLNGKPLYILVEYH
uniref:adenine phosphoribosyltransferase n=1 Tax=Vitis vinifera TaxID=29760 RepID=A5AFA0_VITVI|nr:hypothetical protein VITISV_016996 [Vitis vinifera]